MSSCSGQHNSQASRFVSGTSLLTSALKHTRDRSDCPPGRSPWLVALPFVALLISGGHALSQQPPVNGQIKGTLVINKTDESPGEHMKHGLISRYMTDPAGSELLVHSPESKPYTLSEKAVVYLESEGLGKVKFPVPLAHRVLEQRGLKFHPEVLPVLVGTTVDFPNGDNLFHNVFSYSPTKEFDLGRYPLGDSRSVVFERPGIVKVYCDIHSQMNAIVLVLENPFFVSPDDDGNFRIADVPEGEYRLVVWYGRDVVLRRKVTVKAGETTTLNLVY